MRERFFTKVKAGWEISTNLTEKSGEIAIVSIVILKDFDVKTITYDTDLEFAKHGFLMICWGTRVTSANPRTDGRWVAWKTTAA